MSFISYAENLEDVMLYRALKHIERGFYIDVGALYPDISSVTKAFYDRGWRGINIEPIPEFFKLIDLQRPNDINLNLAVGNRQGRLTLYDCNDTPGLATANKFNAEKNNSQGHDVSPLEVPCKTLDAICEENKVESVHFLKIDVEGAEKEVLEGFSFSRVRPWIVVIEANEPNSTVDVSNQWESLILTKDYQCVYYDGLNRYYLAREHGELKVHFLTPPNVFDHYVRSSEYLALVDLNQTRSDLNQAQRDLNQTRVQLQQWQSGILMNLLNRYLKVVNKVLPPATRRRYYFELVLKGVRIILNEGWRSFFGKARNKVIRKRPEELVWLETSGNRLRNMVRNFSFKETGSPEVSIIIPVHNKWKYTVNCLKSILDNTEGNYEVILINDASSDATSTLLSQVNNLRIINNKKNIGFVDSCNLGAGISRGSYLLFLNNDTMVTKNWFQPLLDVIRKEEVGVVGSKLICRDGTLQEAGSIIWQDGSALGYGRGDDSEKPEFNYLREVDYCTGACLIVKRGLFEKIGGFDVRFRPGYYEETDLCFSIRKLGYKVIYQPRSVVVHFEGITNGTNVSSGIKKYQEINRPKFIAKWNSVLEKQYPNSPANILLARNRSSGKRILFIDDTIPVPSQGSGGPRAFSMLKMIRELGYHVTFFPLDNPAPWQPQTTELQQMGIELFYGKNLNFTEFAESKPGYFELVLVSRPHNMEAAYPIIKKYFPNAKLLYDAEALFSLREILKAKIKGQDLPEKEAELMVSVELGLIEKADAVITVSENERRIILKRTQKNNIGVWGHAIDPQNPQTPFQERKDILFVGGYPCADSPNEDAIIYFARDIFPKVQKELSCQLWIVGINPPDSVKNLASSSIIVTGFVKDLRAYYEKCRVFVVPHRYSAGIPWKLQEAMSMGIPSVISQLTASQLDLVDHQEALVARDEAEFIQKIIDLYSDGNLWHQIQRNELSYIKETCDANNLKEKLKQILR